MAVDREAPPRTGGETGAAASEPGAAMRPGARRALIALGWLCVALGAIGVVVPGMPTTIFLIIALWAFSRSSERFRAWLYDHPRFGPPLQAWHAHGVIPVRAKLAAVTVMAISVAIVAGLSHGWVGPAVLAALLVPVAAFIVTRPSAAAPGR
jgi:uncharacterized membrane protein YbaN (DUF454 family)